LPFTGKGITNATRKRLRTMLLTHQRFLGGSLIMVPNDEFDQSISDWLKQITEGDEQAFERIWKRYHRNLVNLVRNAVSHSPSRFADEEDVVQSALASFFFRVKEGQYPDLRDRTGLWKLLITITLSKARAMSRKEGRRRELLEDETKRSILKEEPSPALLAEIADQWQQLMGSLKDGLLRRVAVAKLEGFTNVEIAGQLDISIATVERKLRLIRELWSSHLENA
jgi:DNA-directed RNA polymerase specialized sigma24 family protein